MNAKKIIMAAMALVLLHTENPLNAQNMNEEKVPRNVSAFAEGEAIECNPQTNKNTWLGPVDDAAYAEATNSAAGMYEASSQNN